MKSLRSESPVRTRTACEVGAARSWIQSPRAFSRPWAGALPIPVPWQSMVVNGGLGCIHLEKQAAGVLSFYHVRIFSCSNVAYCMICVRLC